MILHRLALAVSLTALPLAAPAHPHVFVDVQMTLVFDATGALSGVGLSWEYDDLFTLLLTEDLGIDTDGDLKLTPDEMTALTAAVLDWPEDFGGDLFVFQSGRPLALKPRSDGTVRLTDGRIVESHLRRLSTPATPSQPVTIQVYDPYYYVAYTLVGEIGIDGTTTCTKTYRPADLNTAYSKVDELLYGRPASAVGPNEAFPEVGALFADMVTVTCNG
jgi:ABC-type uncharacterized transport system substrate-binding protein